MAFSSFVSRKFMPHSQPFPLPLLYLPSPLPTPIFFLSTVHILVYSLPFYVVLILLQVKEWAFPWVQLSLLGVSPAGTFLSCFGPRSPVCQISLLVFLPGYQALHRCHKVNQCNSVESLTTQFGKSQTRRHYWPALNRSVLIYHQGPSPNANQREQSLLCELHAISYSISMPSRRWQYLLSLVSMLIKHFMDWQPPWCRLSLQAQVS